MILGVNGGAGDDQFPWIPLLFFILLSLSCTEMMGDKPGYTLVTRLCQIMTRYKYLRGVISGFFKVEVSEEGQYMVAVRKEDIAEESVEILNQALVRDDLERVFCRDSQSIAFQEECNEIVASLPSYSLDHDPLRASHAYLDVSKKIRVVVAKHRGILSEDVSSRLRGHADTALLWSQALEAFSKINGDLTENSNLSTLRTWSNWIELVAESIETHPAFFSSKSCATLRDAMSVIMKVTSQRNVAEPQKNHFRRSLRNSASFILDQISRMHSNGSWELVAGKNSYAELLRESQKRIDLLDNLDPVTDEEAKEQFETVEYLKDAFARNR